MQHCILTGPTCLVFDLTCMTLVSSWLYPSHSSIISLHRLGIAECHKNRAFELSLKSPMFLIWLIHKEMMQQKMRNELQEYNSSIEFNLISCKCFVHVSFLTVIHSVKLDCSYLPVMLNSRRGFSALFYHQRKIKPFIYSSGVAMASVPVHVSSPCP